MLSEIDFMIIGVFKKLFYSLPGASIYDIPIGQLVSLSVLLYTIGEIALYLMPNAAIERKKKVIKK